MKKLLKLGLILTGATAFTLTAANAKCGGSDKAPKEMKCQAGKCGGAMKEKMMKEKKETMEKKKEKMKGKCGQGKCGSK